jgi:elongation factor Ts
MDCKKGLTETAAEAGKGEAAWLEAAQAWLRKKSLDKGDKMAAKAATEGLLGHKVSADGRAITVVEMTANTDFVAKNQEFVKLLDDLVELADKNAVSAAEALLTLQVGGTWVTDAVRGLAGKIGENISVKRVVRVEGDFGYYVHHDNKQGAIVELSGVTGEQAALVGKDMAMHIVFAKPSYLKREEVPPDAVAKEKEIAAERLKGDPKNAKKPPQILEKIAEGQVNKFFSTLVLPDQAYYKDGNKTVAQVLKESNATVKRFVRFQVGVI